MKRPAILWTEGFGNTLNRPTSIYFIQGQATRLIKIGHAINVAKRLRDLQVTSPDALSLLWDYQAVVRHEKELHRHFAEWRVRGEWFEPHESLLRYIRNRKPGRLTKPRAP